MLLAAVVTLVLIAALGHALRGERGRGGMILRRPYNNRYNDASAAREDYLG